MGGTSSGLAVMGEYIYSAEADDPEGPSLTSTATLGDPFHPRLTLRKDFLHLPDLHQSILEPHFEQESRHGRMAASLSRMRLERPEARDRDRLQDRAAGRVRRSALVITYPDHPFGTVSLMRLANPAEVVEPGKPLTRAGSK